MLEKIDKEIFNCCKCIELVEKFGHCNTVSIGKNNEILLVGETPSNKGWRKSGIAWYDCNGKLLPSGIILQKLLDIIELKLEDTSFVEAIKCYPKDRKYLPICRNNCYDYLLAQIKELNPRVILTLGSEATKSILRINFKRFKGIVGKQFILDNYRIIPIYHPSPISPLGYKGNIEIFKSIKKIK